MKNEGIYDIKVFQDLFRIRSHQKLRVCDNRSRNMMNNNRAKPPIMNKDSVFKFGSNLYFHFILILLVEIAAYGSLFSIYFLSDDFNLLVGSSKWLSPGVEFFRPVPHLLMHLFYKVFGMSLFPYHLLSFILHYLNAVILYLILKKILKNSYFALVGSIFFTANFLISEAVSWISAVTSLLVTFFYLLAVFLYIKHQYEGPLTRPGRGTGTVLICLVLGLLTKENAVTLPVLLLLISFYKNSGMKWKKRILTSARQTLPFFLVTFIYLIIRAGSLTTAVADSTLSLGYHNLRNVRHLILSLFTFNPFYDLPFIFIDFKILNLFLAVPVKTQALQINIKFFISLITGTAILLSCLFIIFKGSKKLKTSLLAFLISMGPFIFISSHHLPFGGHFLYPLRLYYLPAAFFFIFFTNLLYFIFTWLKDRAKSAKPAVLLMILLTIVIAFSDVVKIRKRSSDWLTAGNITRSLLNRLDDFLVRSPEVEKMVLFNLPDSYRGVYILRNGLRSAVKLRHPDSSVKFEILKTAPEDYKIADNRPLKEKVIFIDCAGTKLKLIDPGKLR